MRWKLVDSNYLQNPLLRDYFTESKSNGVVLIDLVSIEIHKKNPLVSATQSTRILREFPRQVAIARPTRDFYHWQMRSRAKVLRIISERESVGFRGYIAALHSDDRGSAERHAISRGAESSEAAMRLIKDSEHIPDTFLEVTKQFSARQVGQIRKRKPLDRELQFELLDWAKRIAFNLFAKVVNEDAVRPNAKIRPFDTFVFRYALCIVLLYMRWVYFGRQPSRRPDRLANDIVDLHLAAMSTFFSGVLSKDELVIGVAKEARSILRAAGTYVG